MKNKCGVCDVSITFLVALFLFGFTILSFCVLLSSFVSADQSASKTATIVVPAVCSVNATGMDTHTTSVTPGSYTQNIGTTTATVTCNDNEGFSIYASGFTGDEVNKTNSNKLVGTETSSNATISTGTATSGGTSNWSMKLSTPTSPTPQYPLTILGQYGNYANVPNNYTKVITRTAATDTGEGAIGSTFTTTYATFISHTQTADTYTGKVRYILVHPNTATVPTEQTTEAGYIGYYPNANGVLGEMGKQQATNSQESILYAPNFKRDGYGFAGWNTKPDYTGKMYGPSETIVAPSDVETKGLSLYAVWVQSEGSFQHSATKVCNRLTKAPTDGTATLDSVSALTDIRDGNTYAIAKLADNKCWMIENLRLDDSAILTAGNTNNPSLPLTNVYDTGLTSDHLSSSINLDQTAWCKPVSVTCDDQSLLSTDGTALFTGNIASNYQISGNDGNVYSYGNYYNWYSATAGNGRYDTTSDNVDGDICPSGWRLPTGYSITGDINVLDIALGGTGANSSSSTTPTGATMSIAYRSYPNNFIYSGYISSSSFSSRSTWGYYWLSTAINNAGAAALVFRNNGVLLMSGGSKYLGEVVRCVTGS